MKYEIPKMHNIRCSRYSVPTVHWSTTNGPGGQLCALKNTSTYLLLVPTGVCTTSANSSKFWRVIRFNLLNLIRSTIGMIFYKRFLGFSNLLTWLLDSPQSAIQLSPVQVRRTRHGCRRVSTLLAVHQHLKYFAGIDAALRFYSFCVWKELYWGEMLDILPYCCLKVLKGTP